MKYVHEVIDFVDDTHVFFGEQGNAWDHMFDTISEWGLGPNDVNWLKGQTAAIACNANGMYRVIGVITHELYDN